MRRTFSTTGGRSLQSYSAAYAASRRLRLVQDDAAAAKIDAEQARAAKAAFLSGLNHELRTPLNAIMGFGGLLREHDDVGPEKRAEYLDNILYSAGLLLKHIDAILAAAAGTDEEARPDDEATDPLPVLRRVLQEHAGQLFVGKADIADGLPPVAVPTRDLYQALGRVFAALSVQGQDRQALSLVVAPTGPHRQDVAITFSLISDEGLSLSALRSLRADLIRFGLRLDDTQSSEGRQVVLLLPGTDQEKAA